MGAAPATGTSVPTASAAAMTTIPSPPNLRTPTPCSEARPSRAHAAQYIGMDDNDEMVAKVEG
jgi:hypothetical protein